MKNIALTTLALTLFALPVVLLAKEGGMTVTVAGFIYPYDEVIAADTNGDGVIDRNSYYKEGKLILSAYDENGDGEDDLWLEWKDDKVVLEMRATRGTGAPDEFTVIDDNEQALLIEAPEGSGFFAGAWKWLALLLLLGGVWWYKKKRTSSTTAHASR